MLVGNGARGYPDLAVELLPLPPRDQDLVGQADEGPGEIEQRGAGTQNCACR